MEEKKKKPRHERPADFKGSWQAEKSSLTRRAIMESAIQCFIDLGYTNTTTSRIAEQAGVSRGAMVHHFSSRDEVIVAAVKYLHEKRIQEFNLLVAELAKKVGMIETMDEVVMRETVLMVWDYFKLTSFTAYHELTVAARTNPELAELMKPMQRELETKIAEAIKFNFPMWKTKQDTQELLTDLIFFSLRGMATSYMHRHKKERINNLIEVLVRHALEVYQERQTG